jgi:hypothetical protein
MEGAVSVSVISAPSIASVASSLSATEDIFFNRFPHA